MSAQYREDLSPYSPVVREAMQLGANQRPAELDWLLDQVIDELPFARVLEIGSQRGGTLWLWCQMATDDAQVMAIDDDSFPHEFGDLVNRYPWPARAQQHLHLVNVDSRSEAAAVAASTLGPIDFLFLDGGHRTDLITSDWNTFAPLVHPGGFVAFHDIANDPVLGIDVFWRDVIKPFYKTDEFVDPNDPGMGIGLVYL